MFDFPNSPSTGQSVTGPNGAQWSWDGVKWRATALVAPNAYIGDTPPSNPVAGTLWWDSVGGQLYTFFVDPSGPPGQWVIANQGGVPEAPTTGGAYARSNSQWSDVTSAVNAAPNNTGRNLLHNGSFVVQQRGAGPWTVGSFTADRWSSGTSSDTISWSCISLADADRTAIGDETALTALQNVFTGNAAAGAYNQILQRIENVRRLSGKSVTLSFWAKAASGTPKIGINLYQSFGTGGSPSAGGRILTTGNAVTISTAWTRYSTTMAVTSAAGKTFGTNGDDWSQLELWFSCGATNNAAAGNIGVQSGTIQLWGIQLEYGSVATSLARRDPADELALCQRFYQIGSMQMTGGNGIGVAVGIGCSSLLPVRMRATPTVAGSFPTVTGVTGQGWGALDASAIIMVATANASSGWNLVGNFTASADL